MRRAEARYDSAEALSYGVRGGLSLQVLFEELDAGVVGVR